MRPAVYRIPTDAKGALGVAAFLAVVATIIDDALAVLGLMVVAMPIIIYAMMRIPLRHSMLGLMFFALTLPNPNEGFIWAPWVAPFEKVGWLLTAHWNTIDRSASWLKPAIWSGLDLFFVALGLIVYQRRKSRSKLDYAGAVTTPMFLKKLARISLYTTLFVWISGLARGGHFGMSLWQVNSVIYLPCVFLLFSEAIRGPQDFPAVFRVLCAAAIYRSLLATYIINAFRHEPDEMGNTKLPYATSHADSILFAVVLIAIFIVFLERVVRISKSKLLWVAPIVLLGMFSNNRRLVWVHVAVSLLAIYLLTADNPIKKKLRQLVYAMTPFVLGYVAAGWNSQYGTLFKPVRMLRSVVDAKSDKTGSSYWREIENWNLVATFKDNLLFGTGYGHGFYEIVPLPEVPYELERYCPHNSILGLWAYGGYIGYAGTTMLWAGGVYYAMRAYRNTRDPVTRAGALTSIIGILVYFMHCWGDLGLGTWTGVFTAGAALAVAAKAGEAAAPSVASIPPASVRRAA
jgi:hypothetical protein